MLRACHSLHQNSYAWTRIGSRGSIGVSSHPAQEGSRRLLSSHALARLFPAGATWVGRVRHSQRHSGADIPDRKHG